MKLVTWIDPARVRGAAIIGVMVLVLVAGPAFIPARQYPVTTTEHPGSTIPTPASNPAMVTFHVSPSGNDAANGSEGYPFRTIDRARQAVRNLAGPMTGDIIVLLEGGRYFLNETIAFTQDDSGRDGFFVRYQARDGESPVISGGVPVTGWTVEVDGIWGAIAPVADFRQLYVDGVRATRARGDPVDIIGTTGEGHMLSSPRMRTWRNLQDIEFVYHDIWTLPRVRPFLLQERHGQYLLHMQQPAYSYIRYKPDSQNRAPQWIENAFELLDEPGEWYLDKTLGIVYYMPLPGQDMTTVDVIVPGIEYLVNITGSAASKVSHLRFEGISFEHGSWLQPNAFGTNFVEVQANAYRVPGTTQWDMTKSPGNVNVKHASHVHFENCTFTRLGTAALDLQVGTRMSTVTGCVFNDVSGVALQVGEITNPFISPDHPDAVRDITVMNNYIVNCSREYMSGPGIFATYVRNVRIEHNTISNLPYTGISLGWGWNAAETVAGNNTIKFNRIYGIMNRLEDGGGIYHLSTSPGTNISYNIIHDSGYNGLYIDERTNQTTWTWNVVYDCWNNFLDHSKYEESHWNVVRHNFLEEYPRILWVWYPDRDPFQTWGLSPGDPGFPQWIVDMSGVQPAYRHLVPENEWHYRYQKGVNENALLANPVLAWTGAGAIVLAGVASIVMVLRAGSRRATPEVSP